MSEELNELLNDLKDWINCPLDEIERYGVWELEVNQSKELLDYINQLQQENKLLKQLKAKIIDRDDDIELEYDLGDYLCSIDCCLGQNHEICELKKKIKKLKQDYKCVKIQRDDISKNATETIEKCIEEIRGLKSQLQQSQKIIDEIRKCIYINRKHYHIYNTKIEDWMYIKDKIILQIINNEKIEN